MIQLPPPDHAIYRFHIIIFSEITIPSRYFNIIHVCLFNLRTHWHFAI